MASSVDIPFFMNDYEVCATIGGRKTEFIRSVKPAVINKYNKIDDAFQGEDDLMNDWENYMVNRDVVDQKMIKALLALSPYGGPGDRLWVRESHFAIRPKVQDPDDPCHRPYDLWIDGEVPARPAPGKGHVMMGPMALVYRATGKKTWGRRDWRQSRKMWRWACRLELLIESMRLIRIQDIDQDGAMRQGIAWNRRGFVSDNQGHNFNPDSAVRSLASLWDEMCMSHKPEVGYDQNPLVWLGRYSIDELRVGVVKAEDLKMRELV